MVKLVYGIISTGACSYLNYSGKMRRDLFIAVGIITVSIFILLAIFSMVEQQGVTTSPTTSNKQVFTPQTITSNYVTINLPAVDNQGNGVVAKLKVQVIPGEGRILTNINQLLFWSVIIVIAFIAYKVMPKLKQVRSKEKV